MITSPTVTDVPLYRAIFPERFYSIEAKPDKKSPPITYKLDNPKLRDMTQIYLHAYKRRWALAVDVDLSAKKWLSYLHSFRAMYPELTPSWVFHSLTTGHAHMVWTIDPVTTGPRARLEPQQYAQAVQVTLAYIFEGDPAFNGHMTYNPLYDDYALMDYSTGTHLNPFMTQHTKGLIHLFDRTYLQPRTLGQLREALEKADCWQEAKEARQSQSQKSVHRFLTSGEYILKGERNNMVFYETRHDDRDPHIVAHEINNSGRVQPPLSYAETETIARSVAGFRARGGHKKKTSGGLTLSDEHRATLSQWGHKGGSRNTEAQQKARAKSLKAGPQSASVIRSAEAVGRRAQIRELKAQGYTNKKICELLGVERTTVYRALKG